MKVEFIKTRHPQTVKDVMGFLGSDNMSFEPGSQTMRAGLETQGIFVKSYSDLLMEARNYNKIFIDTFEEIAQKRLINLNYKIYYIYLSTLQCLF